MEMIMVSAESTRTSMHHIHASFRSDEKNITEKILTFRSHGRASEHHQASLEMLVGVLLIVHLFSLVPQHVCLFVAVECCKSIHCTLKMWNKSSNNG